MRKIPAIKSVMSPFPYWIDGQKNLVDAENMMKEHDISHLPVKDNGEIVGVISRHDISTMKSESLAKQQPMESLKVGEICVYNPYVVDMNEPLDNVVLHMAHHHIGSAIVLKNNKLAGVFTANDACREFGEFLRAQFRPQPGNDIA